MVCFHGDEMALNLNQSFSETMVPTNQGNRFSIKLFYWVDLCRDKKV
jgi:hypothetical protein